MTKLVRHPLVMTAAVIVLAMIAAWDHGLLTLPSSPFDVAAVREPSRSTEARGGSTLPQSGDNAGEGGAETVPDQVLMDEIVQRPLFVASRRPPPKPVEAPVQKAAAPPPPPPPPPPKAPSSNFQLLGILAGDGRRIAVIQNPETGQSFRVEQGGAVEVWRVERVGTADVVLAHKSWSVTLKLFKKGT